MHPLYYNLSIATKALLGLAIMICRLVVLRHSEHEEDQEKGFVGNTILLTQPRPEEIIQNLPPDDAHMSQYMSVCFNHQSMTTAPLLQSTVIAKTMQMQQRRTPALLQSTLRPRHRLSTYPPSS